MKKSERRPQERSAAEKLKTVIEFESLPTEKRGEFLRREGLHSDHIDAWKKSMQAGLEPARKIKELEREPHRKDKALAETTALLVLKTKANLIWGTGENE